MRLFEIEDRFPKPDYVIPYDDDGKMGRVFVRPSPGTVMKCINHDCRALIFDNGTLIVWPERDMYHGDVLEKVPHSGDHLYLRLYNPNNTQFEVKVAVKGNQNEDDTDLFTDKNWLSIFHSNRTLVELYGHDFKVEEFNWW